ncbi:MAG: hypothetical protein JJ896_00105 [Rhodothermales bacterium]|nr:hypothetical protein [Rhodothermales bacterium]MBO6778028.1 hypothetical protein [Rhodothermales bacterium]
MTWLRHAMGSRPPGSRRCRRGRRCPSRRAAAAGRRRRFRGHASPGPRPEARALLPLLLVLAGCNPFAPALEEGSAFGDLLGDPTTVDGFFTNFQNAYELRDLSLYEPLLDSSFVFVWRDFDAQVDREWGFVEDLETTRRLFANASLIRLQWNQILSRDVFDPGRQERIVRSFNLTITLEQGDVFRGDGNVNFLLGRADSTANWKLLRWRDESEF